ncbi:hypothetical protein M9H77_08233 [Catharanthus roseus]|uniref:Uncharacterized protein n=1 Tax=Catharanthus roseus TaxID=4058 RepID=A0ACC0BXH1_CATRO|nr:hypothetical protein M9H77_08233 [Catharanthus roseus]
MPSDQFMWLPYYDCPLVPSDLWRAEVPLICYEIVEYHYPGRVMRQFRRAQIWRVRVRNGPAVAAEVLLYPSDEYIKWYRGITRIYIGNPANHDTRAHGYQPAGVDRWMMMMVDDIASVAIREPPLSPSQMAAVMKKVQTIIRRCMATFPVQPSRHRLREHVPDRGARGVKRGARGHPGCGTGAGCPLVPPAPQRQEHVDPGPAVVERSEGSGSGQ